MTVIHVCLFVCMFVSVCLCVCLYEMVTLMMLSGGGRCQPARLRRYRTDGNLVAVAFIFGKRNRGEHENLCPLEKTRLYSSSQAKLNQHVRGA